MQYSTALTDTASRLPMYVQVMWHHHTHKASSQIKKNVCVNNSLQSRIRAGCEMSLGFTRDNSTSERHLSYPGHSSGQVTSLKLRPNFQIEVTEREGIPVQLKHTFARSADILPTPSPRWWLRPHQSPHKPGGESRQRVDAWENENMDVRIKDEKSSFHLSQRSRLAESSHWLPYLPQPPRRPLPSVTEQRVR